MVEEGIVEERMVGDMDMILSRVHSVHWHSI